MTEKEIKDGIRLYLQPATAGEKEKVRELLVDKENFSSLKDVDEDLVTEIVFGNKKKFLSTSNFDTLSTVTHNETDPEVKAFINRISL